MARSSVEAGTDASVRSWPYFVHPALAPIPLVMFFDSNGWPPAPDGFDPRPPRPRVTPAAERMLARLVGLFLAMLLVAPLAGSSVINAVVALAHALMRVI